MDLPRGYRIGHYEITQPLGEGGMGRVYRGRDTRLHRSVAINVMQEAIRSSPDAVSRFDREARDIGEPVASACLRDTRRRQTRWI